MGYDITTAPQAVEHSTFMTRWYVNSRRIFRLVQFLMTQNFSDSGGLLFQIVGTELITSGVRRGGGEVLFVFKSRQIVKNFLAITSIFYVLYTRIIKVYLIYHSAFVFSPREDYMTLLGNLFTNLS